MKMLLILLLFYSYALSMKAQIVKKSKDSCICSFTSNVKVPEVNDDSSVTGTVIVSFELDSNCIFGNAKIEQSLSPVHNAAVLKMMNESLIKHNRCNLTCPLKQPCEKKKWYLPITFLSGD